MPDGSPPAPPAKPVLARAALERVLARAAELQSRSDGGDETPLTEAQLIELAGEVGLSHEHVRQALAEERSRFDLEPESGFANAMLGSATVQATRTVPTDAASVLAALDRWMQNTESLQVKRRFPDQLSWEPRQGFLTAMRRTLLVGGRPFSLAAVTEVHAVIASVEGKKTLTRLIARFDDTRGQRATTAIVGVAIGLLIGLPAFWLALLADLPIAMALSIVPALAVPMLAMALARRGYRRLLSRAQVALEQALDRLEYGDAPRRSP